MPVHFFIPDQMDAWDKLDKVLFAKRAGWSGQVLEQLWYAGKLGIHEMASELGPFGYLVLTTVDMGVGKMLQVIWCEVFPCRALRTVPHWLVDAAAYLREVGEQYHCTEVRICVAANHPSPKWQARLVEVGFSPAMTELSLKVAA